MRLATITLTVLAFAVAAPSAALADQYAWNDLATAKKGAALLGKGRRMISFCEPCRGGHREAAVEITSTKVRRVGKDKAYWEVLVNGEPVDLAYVFVEVSPGSKTFDNVALAIGVKASGVSARITE